MPLILSHRHCGRHRTAATTAALRRTADSSMPWLGGAASGPELPESALTSWKINGAITEERSQRPGWPGGFAYCRVCTSRRENHVLLTKPKPVSIAAPLAVDSVERDPASDLALPHPTYLKSDLNPRLNVEANGVVQRDQVDNPTTKDKRLAEGTAAPNQARHRRRSPEEKWP
jgi:hypothetical protein